MPPRPSQNPQGRLYAVYAYGHDFNSSSWLWAVAGSDQGILLHNAEKLAKVMSAKHYVPHYVVRCPNDIVPSYLNEARLYTDNLESIYVNGMKFIRSATNG